MDGCPMFAQTYMGRKRWAQPYDRFLFDSGGPAETISTAYAVLLRLPATTFNLRLAGADFAAALATFGTSFAARL